MKDRDVIDAFVSYLCSCGHPGLKVDRRPDEDNRNSADIDAIAGSLAIEHTSIDTLPNQRRDSGWFMQAVGGLEQEFPQKAGKYKIIGELVRVDGDIVRSLRDFKIVSAGN